MNALTKWCILCFQIFLVFWMSRFQLTFYWIYCAVKWEQDPSCTSFVAAASVLQKAPVFGSDPWPQAKRYRITEVCADQSLPLPQISHEQMTYVTDTTIPWTLHGASRTLWQVYCLSCAPVPPSQAHRPLWKLGHSLLRKHLLRPSAVGVVSCQSTKEVPVTWKHTYAFCLFQILPVKERISTYIKAWFFYF